MSRYFGMVTPTNGSFYQPTKIQVKSAICYIVTQKQWLGIPNPLIRILNSVFNDINIYCFLFFLPLAEEILVV